MAIIIDGKAVAEEIKFEVAERCARLAERGVEPCLAVVLVGNDPASEIYVRSKRRTCKKCSIISKYLHFDADITQDDLISEVRALNNDKSVNGILVQLPLPEHIDENAVLAEISPEKDVDGLHVINAGKLYTGQDGMRPCTPAGCIELLKRYNIPLDGANAVVIGRSNLVGRPVAMLLMRENCTVTICHTHTKNLAEHVKDADIVIVAAGKQGLVTADMIKPGAAIIDVGINRFEDGTIRGDVDFDSVSDVAGWITPVPGGVGPMTIAMLMKNTLYAAERAN